MAAEKRFGPNVRVYVSPAGVVEPGVRSQVYRLLHEARATVAALVSFVFSLLVLALDHAAIVSAIREFQRGKAPRRRARNIDAGSAYAMVVGAAILVPVFIMSGAKVPYFGTGHVAVLGAAIGYLVSTQSERISPASGEEITAGMAMGLTHTDIMREIVVPSSRPGILSLLNRRKVRFRGTAD
jgi:ABC-type Fe3+ transport system permease subunit